MQKIIYSPAAKLRQLKLFLALSFFLTLIFKCYLAYKIPIISDEAYNFNAAYSTFWGFYDHPGMIVVLINLVNHFTSNIILRSPQILMTTLLGVLPLLFFKPTNDLDHNKIFALTILLIICPFLTFFIFMADDAPLMFFTVLSFFFMYAQATTKKKRLWMLCTGLSLGCAFYSKYLAVPAILAVFYTIIAEENVAWKTKIINLFLVSLGIIPFVAINFIWNYQYWWSNFLVAFAGSRYCDDSFGCHVFTITTPTLWFFVIILILNFRVFHLLKRFVKKYPPHLIIFRNATFAYLLFFTLLAMRGVTISPVWLLPGTLTLLIALAPIVDLKKLQRMTKNMLISSLFLAVIFITILSAPLALFNKGSDFYKTVSIIRHLNIAIDMMKGYDKRGFIVMSTNYTDASSIAAGLNKFVPVFDTDAGSNAFGRTTDVAHNFKFDEGKNIAVFSIHSFNINEYQRFFKSITITTHQGYGLTIYVLEGYNFNYPVYKSSVLQLVYATYYQKKLIPAIFYGPNFFYEKYFSTFSRNR
ncbi:MAG: phospholipid carrier-dependent glycosyltransferase [Gammaproteobacteria bacterium]|nr:phospholipid carrier-dependent glycosyltransferase [Gammaproteobacteria bacterium]